MNADHLQPEHLENRYREARDLVEHTHFYIVWLLASGKPSENDELLARKLTVAPPRVVIGVFGSPRILELVSDAYGRLLADCIVHHVERRQMLRLVTTAGRPSCVG